MSYIKFFSVIVLLNFFPLEGVTADSGRVVQSLERATDDLTTDVLHNRRYITGILLVVLGGVAVLFWDWNKALVARVRSKTEQLSESRKDLEASRAMLLNVLNTVPGRVFWKGADGRYLGCNPSFARDAGLESPSEIIGKSDYELVWKENAAAFRQDDFSVMDTQEVRLNYEEVQQRKGADSRVVLTSKVPLLNEASEVIGVLGTYNDITEVKNAERHLMHLNSILTTMRDINQLIAQEKEPRRLVQRALELLVQDRRMVHMWGLLFNEDEEIFDYCEAVGGGELRQLDDSVVQGRMPACLKAAWKSSGLVIESGRLMACEECESRCQRANTMTVSCVLSFNRRRFGVLLGAAEEGVLQSEAEINLFREVCDDLAFALHTIDLEHQKAQAFMEMMTAKEQAESASKAKDEFLTVMSHEMRTPLNPIMGFANLMRSTDIPEPDRTYLDTIISAAQRQLDLVDSILDFAKLESGSLRPTLSEFRLIDLCRDAVHEVKYATHGLEIRFEPFVMDLQPLPENLAVIGEKTMIRQIVDNLLNNACKYTSAGTVTLSVGMCENREGKTLFHFRVVDTGIGISESHVGQLFDPFTQADSSYTRQYEGVGMGLAVCRKLLDLLGGTIGVKSELGKGSIFWFELSMDLVSGEVPQLPTPKRDSEICMFDRPRHILLVEDNKANVLIVKRLVEKFGGSTRVAVNGKQGVELCREERFDAVLMDLCMPVMNGFDATYAIRHSENLNRETPIIALTADLSGGVRERCLESGMEEYLTKPIRIQQLFETLNTLG
jgi:PAS domain S-box-containing protein